MFTEAGERARALGAWGAVGGAGASGLLLGGVLTDLAGWASVLWINVPIGVGAAVMTRIAVPAGGAELGRGLNLPGALALSAGVGSVILALGRPGDAAVLAPVAAAFLTSFVLIERRTHARLVDVKVLRRPTVANASVTAVLLLAAIGAGLFLTTLYGLAFLPNSFAVVIGSAPAARSVARQGALPVLVAGAPLIGTGALLLAHGTRQGLSYPSGIVPGFGLTGLGLGLSAVAITVAGTAGIAAPIGRHERRLQAPEHMRHRRLLPATRARRPGRGHGPTWPSQFVADPDGGVWAVFTTLGIIVAQRLLPAVVATASAIFLSSNSLSSALGNLAGNLGVAAVGLPTASLIPTALALVAAAGLVVMNRILGRSLNQPRPPMRVCVTTARADL